MLNGTNTQRNAFSPLLNYSFSWKIAFLLRSFEINNKFRFFKKNLVVRRYCFAYRRIIILSRKKKIFNEKYTHINLNYNKFNLFTAFSFLNTEKMLINKLDKKRNGTRSPKHRGYGKRKYSWKATVFNYTSLVSKCKQQTKINIPVLCANTKKKKNWIEDYFKNEHLGYFHRTQTRRVYISVVHGRQQKKVVNFFRSS